MRLLRLVAACTAAAVGSGVPAQMAPFLRIPVGSGDIRQVGLDAHGRRAITVDKSGFARAYALPRGALVAEVFVEPLAAGERVELSTRGPSFVVTSEGPVASVRIDRAYSIYTARSMPPDVAQLCTDVLGLRSADRDPAALALLARLGHDPRDVVEVFASGRSAVARLADGRALAVVGTRTLDLGASARACGRMTFSADGRHLVLERAGALQVIDLRSGDGQVVPPGPSRPVALLPGAMGPEFVVVDPDRCAVWHAGLVRRLRTFDVRGPARGAIEKIGASSGTHVYVVSGSGAYLLSLVDGSSRRIDLPRAVPRTTGAVIPLGPGQVVAVGGLGEELVWNVGSGVERIVSLPFDATTVDAVTKERFALTLCRSGLAVVDLELAMVRNHVDWSVTRAFVMQDSVGLVVVRDLPALVSLPDLRTLVEFQRIPDEVVVDPSRSRFALAGSGAVDVFESPRRRR